MHQHGGLTRALGISFILVVAFAALEVVVGLGSGSLALVADAGHMVVDSAGLAMALAAAAFAGRPADRRRTFGYARAEVLVVPVHVALMLGIASYIALEAVGRLRSPEADISPWPVLLAGVVGLAINALTFRLVHGHAGENLNARAATMEVLADGVGSAGVIASAVVVLTTGWTGVDIVVAAVIAIMVVPRAVALLRQSLHILLEGAPRHLDIARVERDAGAVAGVVAVHDLHVWSLAPGFVALSAHIEVRSMDGCDRIIADVGEMLRRDHAIAHVTLQPETLELHRQLACCDFPDADPAAHDHLVSPPPGRGASVPVA